MKPTLMAAAGAVVLLAASAASAGVLYYRADLKGADASHPKGMMKAVLDTDSRALDVTVTGFGGPATTAGFAQGAAAKAELPVPLQGASPAHATVKLTDTQIDELNAGRLSFYVDSKADPAGELRGKVSRSSD